MPHNQICAWCEDEMNPCPDPNCQSTQDHDLAGVFCQEKCADDWIEANEEETDAQAANRLLVSLNQAQAACRKLIAAYEEHGENIYWKDLETAYDAACEALGHTPLLRRIS